MTNADPRSDVAASADDAISDEVKQEIANARAAREALTQRREARAAARAGANKLEAEKRLLDDEAALDDAEEKLGEVGRDFATVYTDRGVVILKRAHANVFRRFQDKGDTSTEALEKLVYPCVTHPSRAALEALFEVLPATLLRCADAIAELAGVRAEDVQKKRSP